MKLSEGGPPCLHEKKDYNAQVNPPKQDFELFSPAYYTGCPNVTIANKTFSTSTLYNQVRSFRGVSELKLLKQNDNRGTVANMKNYPAPFSSNKLDTYIYNMYAKNYLSWRTSSCTRTR